MTRESAHRAPTPNPSPNNGGGEDGTVVRGKAQTADSTGSR
jgi:hypothetical protein